GMHAKQDNPELERARMLGLKIYSFPEYIYQQSRNKKRIAIGGSHGKTSTTAMIMHVLKELASDFDYLVGAKLIGFENSVKITDAPLIVCEADEYPASVIEKRPKFHFLFPHIAVLTGIAWDHINVFPTFDFYLEQFSIFINKIESGGVLIYNESDEVLNQLIQKNMRNDLRYHPYKLPTFFIENGISSIMIGEYKAKLKVFGNHNLLNITAAYYVCKELQITDGDFASAIGTFSGASKRLEVLAASKESSVYRDFAHAPSKVKASTDALSQQFPGKTLIAVLELHTYSSLNAEFLHQYDGTLDNADHVIVFYSNHALELKQMPTLKDETIIKCFGRSDLLVINKKAILEKTLKKYSRENANFLFMSSGDYEGMNILQTLSL
ncbi:MAG: Mur ligase family protein, partial [Ginsengibacter sp.]